MNEKSKDFFRKMLDFLPSTNGKYEESIAYYGKVLEITIIEEVFMPEIINLICENKNNNLLVSIFEYFEEVSKCDDKYLLNIFSVGALEVLGNDKDILRAAQSYMGEKTIQLQIEADKSLRRI
jgi:hypothetical protein